MTVRELIEALSNFDPDEPVFVFDRELKVAVSVHPKDQDALTALREENPDMPDEDPRGCVWIYPT